MARNSESLNTLISTSGTIAGMGLAIVGILAAKQSMQYSEMISDDMFLFRPSAFCWWWLSAIWRKNIANSITTPAWCGWRNGCFAVAAAGGCRGAGAVVCRGVSPKAA